MKDLTDAMNENGVKPVFGLEAQGHLPTIEKIITKWNNHDYPNLDMTYSKHVWDEIGKEIGWCPFTAALSYFQIKNKQ